MSKPDAKGQQNQDAERKFSQEQYDMLLRCSYSKEMTEWNEWRKANPDQEILLERADLVLAHLEGADLTQAHLEGAKLGGAHLEGADLLEAHLEGAELEGAHLEGADLRAARPFGSGRASDRIEWAKCPRGTPMSKSDAKGRQNQDSKRKFSREQYDMLLRCWKKKDVMEWNEWRKAKPDQEILLEGANLRETRLEGAHLSGAHLEGAKLAFAHLERAHLTGAHLEGADLLDAHLEGAYLLEAHLEHTHLLEAHLEGADLREAHLEGANLTGTHLEGADLHEAHLEQADLQEAHLEGAELGFAHLEGAKLRDAHLEGEVLREAHLERADLREAHLESADLSFAHLEGADLRQADLEGANLGLAHLDDANLRGAYLRRACLKRANLVTADMRDANLWHTNLDGAKLVGAHLGGANLLEANVKGTNCTLAIVDGNTLIEGCRVDKGTDFTGVGLDSARVEPGLKQLLQYNVRRIGWREWYEEGNWVVRALKRASVQLFWLTSDYGRSTKRILGVFLGLALAFAIIYHCAPSCLVVRGGELRGFLHALYFSVVTMTTLGFGDIHASPDSWGGQVLLMFQVILGYVLLGALVTRFAVLFQAGGPAQKFPDEEIWKRIPPLVRPYAHRARVSFCARNRFGRPVLYYALLLRRRLRTWRKH